ncbi:hypothetical protein GCU49_20245 [Modestobacter roseus]|nr:hypothetical protein [Modestobacter roseus]
MRTHHDGTDPATVAAVSDTLEPDADDDTAGWSPPDRPWVSTGWGTTEREEAGESLSGRLARELRDGGADDEGADDEGDGLGDDAGTDGELRDDEVGDDRAGRLADDDDGVVDTEDELYAEDEGVDGGGASAEEAAVHVVRDAR